MRVTGVLVAIALLVSSVVPGLADDSERLLTIDHYVRVRSAVPSMEGQPAHIYVRERVMAGIGLRGGNKVVLFVHGRGTPAEVAFDVPYQGD